MPRCTDQAGRPPHTGQGPVRASGTHWAIVRYGWDPKSRRGGGFRHALRIEGLHVSVGTRRACLQGHRRLTPRPLSASVPSAVLSLHADHPAMLSLGLTSPVLHCSPCDARGPVLLDGVLLGRGGGLRASCPRWGLSEWSRREKVGPHLCKRQCRRDGRCCPFVGNP